jgi:hypothetical protein
MRVAISENQGKSWGEQVFRSNGVHDIGYPQLFMRHDGVPVCVYYWSDGKQPQGIVATALDDL